MALPSWRANFTVSSVPYFSESIATGDSSLTTVDDETQAMHDPQHQLEFSQFAKSKIVIISGKCVEFRYDEITKRDIVTVVKDHAADLGIKRGDYMINQELEHRTLLHDEVAISLTGTSSWKCEATYDSGSLKITCSCNRLQKFGFCCKEIIRVLMLLQQHVPQFHDAKTFTNAIYSHVAERWNKFKSPSQDALVTYDRQAAAPCNR